MFRILLLLQLLLTFSCSIVQQDADRKVVSNYVGVSVDSGSSTQSLEIDKKGEAVNIIGPRPINSEGGSADDCIAKNNKVTTMSAVNRMA